MRDERYPNYSFIIESFTPEGEKLVNFRIDQEITNPGCATQVRRLHNTIETHLHWLQERTGLSYNCFLSGPKPEVDRTVACLQVLLEA